jgi:hypothetical protein
MEPPLQIVDLNGKRYCVSWVQRPDGTFAPIASVQVRKAAGGTTWRSLSGYGRANRDRERRAVIAQATQQLAECGMV